MVKAVLLLSALGQAFGGGKAHWVYAKQGTIAANAADQLATWGGLCTTGHEQSPINIVTTKVKKASMPSIKTSITAQAKFVKNSGHGFQLFETSPQVHDHTGGVDATGTAKGHSMIGGAKYNFYQVHWHAPSENTIDGTSYAMEAHFVHQLDDAALHGSYERLAVIGLFYELGTDQECNAFLDKFWAEFPSSAGREAINISAHDFNAKLARDLDKGYYHWYGSLTTPPCTEGVSWNLIKAPQKVCKRQVDALKAALGNTQHGINFNNRVTKPLNHRVVAEMDPSGTPAGTNAIPVAPTGKWVYAKDGATKADAAAQTSTWGGLCTTGHEQSPINIDTTKTAKTSQATIETHINTKATYVKNTGHGLQLFETSPDAHKIHSNGTKNTAVDSPGVADKGHSIIGGQKYNFYQVHWHTPSENTINGKEYAMEAHFVHQLADPAVAGTFHRLAVIALMYELGTDQECNEFLAKFWNDFPTKKGNAPFLGSSFDLNKKLEAELTRGYYHWYGSLTTPPCTEGVSWNVLKVTEKVCPAQLTKLQDALGTTQHGLKFNNRVPQPLHHRVVSETTDRGITTTKNSSLSDESSTVRQGPLILLAVFISAVTFVR
jgi:carbonic anhydrase